MFSADEWRTIKRELGLSPRELEIVQHVFEDSSEQAIGQRLGISPHTVHTYVRRIYAKLDIDSRCQLLLRVMETYLSLRSRTGQPTNNRPRRRRPRPEPAAREVRPV